MSKNKNNNKKSISLSDIVSRNIKNRRFKDYFTNGITSIFSFLCVLILALVIGYVLVEGSPYLTTNFITTNYAQSSVTLKTENDFVLGENRDYSDLMRYEDTVYSDKWGIGIKSKKDNDQNDIYYISEISVNSPFNNEMIRADDRTIFQVTPDFYINYLTVRTEEGTYVTVFGNDDGGAEAIISTLDQGIAIQDSDFKTLGGGIRSSLITTVILILFTIVFSLPLGVGGAIYLAYYAKNNRLTRILRSLVDMSSGIPSIIFGLVGAAIFIPIMSSMTGAVGGNVITGSLTLTLILLPTIVKTVEESIKAINPSLIQGSLALGASNFQTIFKIIIPNSLDGILNAAILSIGRAIGESAALVFAMGTLITATPSLTSSNTSLAVHIWYILSGEHPAYGQACAISIMILCVVLVLSIISKVIPILLNRRKKKGAKQNVKPIQK